MGLFLQLISHLSEPMYRLGEAILSDYKHIKEQPHFADTELHILRKRRLPSSCVAQTKMAEGQIKSDFKNSKNGLFDAALK